MKGKIRKNTIPFLLLLILSLLLAACSSGQDSGNSAASDTTDSSVSDADSPEDTPAAENETIPLGTVSMEDINGETYTEAMFQDYELTFVNVFATWCSPCIAEIPDLEQLHQDMADQGVNVVGIVLDTADGKGGTDPEALETAQLLAEETGASYPFLVPDAGLMNGLLTGIQAVPTSFFVDSEGNLVGNVYTGSRSLEDWTEIVNQELEALEAAQ